MTTLRRPNIRIALLLAATMSCHAWAGAVMAADEAKADALFKQGRDAAGRGDFVAACPLFDQSHKLDPKIGRVMNLADCEEHTARLVQALNHWSEAITLGEASNDERVEYARARRSNLEPRVPQLTIAVVSKAPAGTQVLLNGSVVGASSLGSAMPVNPGTAQIVIRAPGFQDHSVRQMLVERDHKVVIAEPSDARAPVGGPEQSSLHARGEPRNRTWAYAAGTVGAAGLIVATVTGFMMLSKRSAIQAGCNEYKACTEPSAVEAADSMKTLWPINTAAWVVGVVGVGAGTYLFLSSAPSAQPSPARATADTAPVAGLVLQAKGVF
jgi:hypothetical protein